MGSFVAMSMMGLFPNPGQSVYLITVPFFNSVKIKSPLTGKTATVQVTNWDQFNSLNNTGGTGFIQSAYLNGKPYTRSWLDHDFFTEGKDLVLTLSGQESTWGTAPEDRPPSLEESASEVQERRWKASDEEATDSVPLLGSSRKHYARHSLHFEHHARFAKDW
jgi:putative alpha-1,2-mannosidase